MAPTGEHFGGLGEYWRKSVGIPCRMTNSATTRDAARRRPVLPGPRAALKAALGRPRRTRARSHVPRPAEARTAVTVYAHLTALLGADLAEAHVEARDRRTGALVAYSLDTIHLALALHVAEVCAAFHRPAQL
jgi:hypothetical protein